MTNRLRNAVVLAATVAAVGALLAVSPAQAAPKFVEGTIAIPGNNVAGALGAGEIEVVGAVPTRRTCPGPGEFDGVLYKFFDLKGLYKNFKLTGPAPAVSQAVPVLEYNQNEYDLDIYGFDAKCNIIEGGSGVTGTSPSAFEVFRPKKPVQYIVVKYYVGPYPNIPFKVEYS